MRRECGGGKKPPHALNALLQLPLAGVGHNNIGGGRVRLEQVGEVKQVSAAEIARGVKAGAANSRILLGVAFEAVFFGCLLVLMSRREANVSFIWPLTALGFVFTALAARFYLREEVHWIRWSGIIFIMIGAALVSYSEKAKDKRIEMPKTASTPDQKAP